MKIILQNRFSRFIPCLIMIALLCSGQAFAQWKADTLPGYSQRTINLQPDKHGEIYATLVRHDEQPQSSKALLYVHGYNDYFFQSALGDSITKHGYRFYALDLRRYGRSLRSHQDPFAVRHLSEYYAEIDSALSIIRAEGALNTVLMAHSTGGLITSLYLADTHNKDSISAFVLNSPFFDFNFPKWQERSLIPILSWWAKLFPNLVASGRSKHPSMYARSLQSKYEGKWTYNADWKKDNGHPIRLAWLRAIRRGHKQIHRGLDLKMPILLMSSDRSIRASAPWRDEYGKADLVLDVKDIERYGQKIGSQVKYHQVPGGLHDLFLSTDSLAYEDAYQTLFKFLNNLNASLSK